MMAADVSRQTPQERDAYSAAALDPSEAEPCAVSTVELDAASVSAVVSDEEAESEAVVSSS